MAERNSALDARRLDLDWIRIGAFSLLILYHVGMYYVPWTWHVKSEHSFTWLEPVMALTNPWRLTLLFIVSGAASRFMLDKLGPARFARARTVRLLVPLLFGMYVVVPPQTWLQVAQSSTEDLLPYGEFYLRYVSSSGGWSAEGVPLSTPTWNHLWFVAYLLVYTLLLSIGCVLWRGLPSAMSVALTRIVLACGVAAPAAWFVFVRLILHPAYPETHALFSDWTVHAESAASFLFGFAAARAPAVWSALESRRRLLGVLALASNLSYAGALALWIGGAVPATLAKVVMSWSFGLAQWFTAAAALAYGSAHLRASDHPCRRYLAEGIFPFYIVHQTLIIGTAAVLQPFRLGAAAEAAVLVLATAAGCLAAYELVRRSPILRPLFGLRNVRRSAVA